MTSAYRISGSHAGGPLDDDRYGRVLAVELLGWGFLVLSLGVWALAFAAGLRLAILAFTAIGLIAAAVGLFYPAVGLFGIGILCTTDTLARFGIMTGGLLRYNTFNYWLSLVALLYAPFLLRLRNSHCIIWQLFVLLLVVQLSYSPDRYQGILQLLYVISPLGLLVYFVRTCQNERLWYWVGVVSGSIGAVGGAVVLTTDTYLIQVHGNQYTFFPISAMFSICLAFPYATSHRRGQVLLLVMAALNFGWVMLTGSRGGLLIATIAMSFLLLELRGTSRRILVFGLLALLATTAIALFPSLIANSIHRTVLLLDSDYSMSLRTSGRSELVLGGWYIFREHPLGVGTGGYENAWVALDVVGSLSGFSAGKRIFAHAAWVKTLAENGVGGLLLHLAFVMSFVFAGFRERKNGLLALGILVSLTLGVVHMVHEFAPRGPWMLTAGAIVMLNREEMLAALDRSLGRRGLRRREP